MDSERVELGLSTMSPQNNDASDSQNSLRQESVMKPLSPDVTQQPLHEETLAEMQPKEEDVLLENRDEQYRSEDMDEIVQEGNLLPGRHIVDRQDGIVNRSGQ